MEKWQSGRMYLTRNQAYRKVPWVRIPPSPPTSARVCSYENRSKPFLVFSSYRLRQRSKTQFRAGKCHQEKFRDSHENDFMRLLCSIRQSYTYCPGALFTASIRQLACVKKASMVSVSVVVGARLLGQFSQFTLAVNSDNALDTSSQNAQPLVTSLLQRLGVDQPKRPCKGLVRRNAIRQL